MAKPPDTPVVQPADAEEMWAWLCALHHYAWHREHGPGLHSFADEAGE